jgi:hypothetical protein
LNALASRALRPACMKLMLCESPAQGPDSHHSF